MIRVKMYVGKRELLCRQELVCKNTQHQVNCPVRFLGIIIGIEVYFGEWIWDAYDIPPSYNTHDTRESFWDSVQRLNRADSLVS